MIFDNDFLSTVVYNNADMNLLRGNALNNWAGRKTRVHQMAGKTPVIFIVCAPWACPNG